jgi:hypothetical protein
MLVASGALHLSAVCSLAPHLNRENATELFEASRHESRRQVDELVAAQFPKADVRERIRLDPLSVDRYGLQFTIDREALEELERVRALARHRLPDGELSALFKIAMRTLRVALEKQRFGVGAKPRTRKPRPTLLAPDEDQITSAGGGEIPTAAAREVYERDERRCAYVSRDGRRCGATAFLEIDHTEPKAVGGTPTATNLRLRCRAHNQMHARHYFGAAYLEVAIRRARCKRLGRPVPRTPTTARA